jgi:hypothetical protein
MIRRLVVLLLTIPLLAAACGGGSPAMLTPVQRLHAAVRAAVAVYDPDSAGGTGYGTTGDLLRRMGPGAYGTPQAWPDDLAFRPGIVYVATDNGGRLASLWTITPSGGALLADVGPPHHRVGYQTRSAAEVAADGLLIVRPGVLSGDMIRSALAREGFHGIELASRTFGTPADSLRPLTYGGTASKPSTGNAVGFIVLRSPSDAHKAAARMKLPPHHVSVVVGNAWIHYSWTGTSPDRSRAFARAVAALRKEARTA